MVDTIRQLARSDQLLCAIAVILGLALLLGALPAVPLSLALGLGGVPAAAGVWYALFRVSAVR